MSAIATLTARRPDQEWFEAWFNSPHYHRLYAHRDEAEAASFINRLIRRLGPNPGAAMLDLGCGTGRHARQLAAHGFRVTGVDLSAESLARARRHIGAPVRYVEQDMRQSFGAGAFDYVFSLFTSFGYFDDPADHALVVRNMVASLKPEGAVVLDYLNVERARTQLIPEERVERDDASYVISRWLTADAFFKRIVIEQPGLPPVEHVERVARLEIADFYKLFAGCGLEITAICGDYELGPFEAASSPRLILVASRT